MESYTTPDATYWTTTNDGHGFPGGQGFDRVLDEFLVRSLKLDSTLAPKK